MHSLGSKFIYAGRWRTMMKLTGAFHDFVNTPKSWETSGFIMQINTGTKFCQFSANKNVDKRILILDWVPRFKN